MENSKEEIKRIIGNAEEALRQVIVRAAENGDYRGVDTARAIAVKIHELKMQLEDSSALPTVAKEKATKVGKSQRGTKKSKRNKGRKSGYPKFEVKKGMLIRIGWSKKQKREYTHKVPKVVFDVTVKAMARVAKSGAGPFMAEEVIERVNELSTEAIPSYQVYVVIGLLRMCSCIKQIGREGYSIPENIEKVAENAWEGMCHK